MSEKSTYEAFISYSHKDARKLGPEIQAALHRIGRPWYRLRACRVFLDQNDLSAAPDLWAVIEDALQRSQFLILLASPAAQQSKWVAKEIATWIAHKGNAKRILIALVSGGLQWHHATDDAPADFDWSCTDAVPKNLSGVFSTEPLWIDLRDASTTAARRLEDPSFHASCAKIAATVREIELDKLVNEDHRLHRQTIRLATAAVVIVILLSMTAIGALLRSVSTERERQAEELRRKEADLRVESEAKLAAARDIDAKLNAASRASLRGKFGLAYELIADADQEDPRVRFARWVLSQHLAYPTRQIENIDADGFGSLEIHPKSGELLAITQYDPHQLVVLDERSHAVISRHELDERLNEVSAAVAPHTFYAFGGGLERITISGHRLTRETLDSTGSQFYWFHGTDIGLALDGNRLIELKAVETGLETRVVATLPLNSKLRASADRTLIGVYGPSPEFEHGTEGLPFTHFLRTLDDAVVVDTVEEVRAAFLLGRDQVASLIEDEDQFVVTDLKTKQNWTTRSIAYKPWPGLQFSLPGCIIEQEVGDTSHETVASMAVLELATGQDLLDPFLSKEPVWSATKNAESLYITGQGGWIQEVETVQRVRSVALPHGIQAPIVVRDREILLRWSFDLDGNASVFDTEQLAVTKSETLMTPVEYEFEGGGGIIMHDGPFIADVTPDLTKIAFTADSNLWIVELTNEERELARQNRLVVAQTCQRIVERRAERSIWRVTISAPQNLRWVNSTILAAHGFEGHAVLVDTDARQHYRIFEHEAVQALSRRGPVVFSTWSGTIYEVHDDGTWNVFCRSIGAASVFPLDKAGKFFVAALEDPPRTAFAMRHQDQLVEVVSLVGPGAPVDAVAIDDRVVIAYENHLRIYHGWHAGPTIAD